MIPGANVFLSNGNIGGSKNTSDGVVAQVITGTGSGTIPLLQCCKFVSLADAIAQGLTAAVEPEAFQFVSDFYNDAPIGSVLYLMLVVNTTSLVSICDKTNASGAKKLLDFAIANAGGQIRVMGVSRSPGGGYTPANTNFIDADAVAAGANAYALSAQYFGLHTPCRVLIGARVAYPGSSVVFAPNTVGLNRCGYTIGGADTGLISATASVVTGYVTGTYTKVPAVTLSGSGSGAQFTVVIGSLGGVITMTPTAFGSGYQPGDTFGFPIGFDGGFASNVVGTVDTISGSFGSAGMGTILAKVAATAPQVNIGKVKDGPLSVNAWFIGALPITPPADGVSPWYQQLNTLIDAGYITATTYPNGTAGYFISDDPMATDNTDDYQSLANCRVIDKASIIAYGAFVQYVNDEVDLIAGGTMDPADIVDIQSQIVNAMAQGLTGNISGTPSCYIDPTQVFSAGQPFNAKIRVTPKGYLKQIEINLGFSF